MLIELKGIVQYYDQGHKYVDVVVSIDGSAKHERHEMGVDIGINKGKIINFIADTYDVRPGDIAWPDHIILN